MSISWILMPQPKLAPAQLITAPAQPPSTGAAVSICNCNDMTSFSQGFLFSDCQNVFHVSTIPISAIFNFYILLRI